MRNAPEALSGQRPDGHCGHHSQTPRMQLTATMQASAKRKAPAEKTQAAAFPRRASLAMFAVTALY